MSHWHDDIGDGYWEQHDARDTGELSKGETEMVICSDCNGSGEGMFDGSRCSTCGGSGEIEVEADDLDEVGELAGQDEGELPEKGI